ncbi:MAG: S-layer homology domain-containing protein, partial [Oscillospiraceae bacterium]|nr:S-layer homology domain-containing protein [Oscillospiraceae bacterium]
YQDGTTTKSMADGCMGDATVTLSGTTYTVSIPLTSITMDYGDSTYSGTISDIKIKQASDCDVINNTLVFTVSSDDFAELTFDATMSVTVTAISGSGGYTHNDVAADIVLSKASSMVDGYSSLVLATDVGSVTLDSAILEGITETATLTIAVNSTYSNYTDDDGHVFVCGYDLTLSTDFNGGTATVSVPCESTDVVYAYCIDDDGSLAERAALTVVSGYASWSTTHFSTWALSEKEYTISSGSSSGSSSGGSSGGSSSSTSSSFLNTDGNYLVTITLYKESANEVSMGDVAFEYNRSALVTVKDGEITYVEIATNPVKVDLYVSAMTALALTNGGDVEVLERGDFSTSYNGTTTNTYEDDSGYIKRASFDMPDEGQPSTADSVTYVNVTFTVPDTPMDDLYEELAARIQFDWSTATKTSKSHLTANTSTATGSSSSGGGTATTVEDISLTDSATGIKLETNTNRLDSEAELRVTVVTEGDDYDNAASLMGTDDEWTLYEIVALVDGTVTAPSGSVTLYIPCTDEEGLTVYRINDSGRTVIKGSVSGSYYTFTTSSLGLFAIIGSVADASEIVQVSESGFTDIVGHWAEEYIETVVQRGLFNGTSDTTFEPEIGLTRGMFVTVLGRLYGIDAEAEFTNAFDDVDAEAYYAPYIAWASENGIVNGVGGGAFEPDREITRQEMATVISRYFEFAEITPLDGEAVSYADDADIADWAREGVENMTKAGLFSGTDKNEFNPLGTATRAEAATVFARLIGSYGL